MQQPHDVSEMMEAVYDENSENDDSSSHIFNSKDNSAEVKTKLAVDYHNDAIFKTLAKDNILQLSRNLLGAYFKARAEMKEEKNDGDTTTKFAKDFFEAFMHEAPTVPPPHILQVLET